MNIILLADLVIVCYILYKIFYCAKKGFVYTIAQLIGTIATWGIAWFYSPILAKSVYEGTARDFLFKRVMENADYFVTTSLDAFMVSLREFFANLPPVLSGILSGGLEKYGQEYFVSMESVYPDSTALAQGIMEGLIDPLALGIVRGICFVGLFIAIGFIVRLILPIFKGFNYIPIIGGLNSFLGGISGILLGVVYVYVGAGILWILLTFLGGIFPFFSFEMVEKTVLLRLFFNSLPWMSGF